MDELDAVGHDRQEHSREVAFFPEWGRPWPLWGIGRRGLSGIDDDLASRLGAWCEVWQTELNPVLEMKWKDPQVGHEWIREGYALVAEVQQAVGGQGITIIPSFAMYAPPSGA